MEKASKNVILLAFFVIASSVIGGPIAKVEASRGQPAEAEAEAIAEQLITTLESTLTDTVRRCPFPCSSDGECFNYLCGKTRCEYIKFSRLKRCV